jgi:phosphatidylglycerophosphate synthase
MDYITGRCWCGWYKNIVLKYVSKPRRTYEYPINRFYAHKIDPVFTFIADRMGVSPNAATLISLMAGIVAALSILTGHFVCGALLIQFHHLIDGVDGNLARYQHRCTEFGRKFDIVTDQIVRFSVFVSLAITAMVPHWLSWAMLITVYLDIVVVTVIVTPYSKRNRLVRSRWKKWFMDRGLMPGFDIFTIYFIVSTCLLFGTPESAVVLVAVLKTVDWSYRLWECGVTAKHLKSRRKAINV